MELPKSKFLPFFQSNIETLKATSQLIGDILIVERIRFPEKKVGSLFIADSRHIQSTGLTSETPEFYRVLLAGEGYFDEEGGADVPLEVTQGDIVHASSVSVRVWSSFPGLEVAEADILGKMRYGDVQWKWNGEDAFLKFLNDFNQTVKNGVGKSNLVNT